MSNPWVAPSRETAGRTKLIKQQVFVVPKEELLRQRARGDVLMVENEGSRAVVFLLRVSVHPISLLVGTAVCLSL